MSLIRTSLFMALASSLMMASNVSAQIIDTELVPVNIAFGAFTETNGSLWSGGWTTDILVDGNRNNVIHGDGAGGVTGFPEEPGFSYTIDLGDTFELDGITLFPRQNCCPDRLRDFRVSVLGEDNSEVWGIDLFPETDATEPVMLGAGDATGTFAGRYIVVTSNQDPVEDYELQLTEIEVYAGTGVEVPINYALGAAAYTNGTIYSANWPPSVLTDGAANIIHGDGPGGTTGFAEPEGFYYEIDLGQEIELAEVHILPRQDGCCPERLSNYLVTVHTDNDGQAGDVMWSGVYRDDFSFPDGPEPDIITADGDPNGTFIGQWVRVTSLDSQDDIDDGLVDYRLQMSEIEVYGHIGSGLLGDFDSSGVLDAIDINILSEAVRDGETSGEYDLNDDGEVDGADRVVWVNELRGTYFGDSNLDGEFNSNDFVTVFSAGEFEDGIPNNSVWETGDWDGDGEFGTSDFVAAFQTGAYEAGPREGALAAVPEPSSIALLLLGATGFAQVLRRNR